MNISMLQKFVNSFTNVLKVGRGAFGTVYKISKLNPTIEYALKETKIENINIFNNNDVLKIGRHVNLLEYFGLFISPRIPIIHHSLVKNKHKKLNYFYQYVITKYCAITLRTLLRNRNKTFNEQINYNLRYKNSKLVNKKLLNFIFRNIVRGVLYLHKNQIIHRDLKPENIFFEDEKNLIPKIGDFGCCKHVNCINNKDEINILKSTEVGSLNYLAPEVITGIYNNKIDVYSLGLIYLEMLYPMITNMERVYIFDEIKNMGRIPLNIGICLGKESDIINMCIRPNPNDRIGIRTLFSLLINEDSI